MILNIDEKEYLTLHDGLDIEAMANFDRRKELPEGYPEDLEGIPYLMKYIDRDLFILGSKRKEDVPKPLIWDEPLRITPFTRISIINSSGMQEKLLCILHDLEALIEPEIFDERYEWMRHCGSKEINRLIKGDAYMTYHVNLVHNKYQRFNTFMTHHGTTVGDLIREMWKVKTSQYDIRFELLLSITFTMEKKEEDRRGTIIMVLDFDHECLE